MYRDKTCPAVYLTWKSGTRFVQTIIRGAGAAPGEAVSVLLARLDQFEQVNDIWGQLAGNAVLVAGTTPITVVTG